MDNRLCVDRVVAADALAALPQGIARHALGTRLLIVGDDTTLRVAGDPVTTGLPAGTSYSIRSLGNAPRATMHMVESIAERLHETRATGLLAVGAGTVNDCCKLAAYRNDIPYVAVATAASMNGYTSATASIETEGWKQSHRATPPRAVFADLAMLAAAPIRLMRAGLADTLCRSTVEFDCLLSNQMLGTSYPQDGFRQLRQREILLMDEAKNIHKNMHSYLELLMHTLMDAGDWMAREGSSAIASQGEHMIAHTIEMLYEDVHRFMHGEIIAVTTLTMQERQRSLWERDLLQLGNKSINRQLFIDIFGESRGMLLADIYKKKLLDDAPLLTINHRLHAAWPEIKRELADVMLPQGTLEKVFAIAGINGTPQAIELDENRYAWAVCHAHLTRERFTTLDFQ